MSGESFAPQPITMFGGWVPNGAPEGLPNGMSWDCQDVDLVAAGVRTRPGLLAQFPSLSGKAYINYLKTFPTLNSTNRLLVLDSLGNLYKETPEGVLELVISALAEGALCRSETQFGREYLAFSNGKNGIDLPRQFDDTNFDRVSQCGPGAGPVVGAAGGSSSSVGIVDISRSVGVVTVKLAAVVGWAVGSQVVIQGVTGSTDSFNGTFTITQVSTPELFFFCNQSGVDETGNASGATATPAAAGPGSFGLSSIQRSSNVVTVAAQVQTGLAVGEQVTIAGVTGSSDSFNGTFTVTSAPTPSEFTYDQTGINEAGNTAGATGTPVTTGGGGTTSGTITGGTHQVAVSFVTRQGYWTRPSPPVTFTAADGSKLYLTGIPTGPANVVARVLMFTPAGQSGAPSFYTLAPAGSQAVAPGPFMAATTMYIPDNSTTSATLDFSDDQLLAGTPCGYLFDLVELPEQAGVIAYSDRLFWWGERTGQFAGKNGVWLNLTFDGSFGGTNTPLGWTADPTYGGGGSRESANVAWGDAYRITGDGATAVRGKITQSAYQDYNGVPLISPNTAYGVRARVAGSGLTQGTLHINLYSPSLNYLSFGLSVPFSQLAAGTAYREFVANLAGATDLGVIPSDLVLQVYANGTPTGGGYFLVDNIEISETALGELTGSLVRSSRVNDPESYDGVNGMMLVSPNDGQRITNAFVLRNNLYIVKERALYVTTDDGVNEPALWAIEQISNRVGTPSVHGVAMGEQAAVIAGENGVYVFDGSPPQKISQEIHTDQRNLATGQGPAWDQVNWAAGHTIWAELQEDKKRLLIGAPFGMATMPNWTLAMYYPYDAESLASVTIFRKFKDAPLARGWAPWTIAANCAASVARPDGTWPIFLGSNDGSGNVSALAEGVFSDNGKVIPAYYTTYFVNGSDLGLPPVGRKLFGYLRINAEGRGTLVVAGFPTANRALPITAISRSGNLATVTTAMPHGLYNGQLLDIQGVADASYDGQALVLSTSGATQFTYGNDGARGDSSGGTVTPLLGTLALSSPALRGNLELPINISGEMLALRVGIDKTGNAGDWFSLSQRIEVYLKLDPWAPFGSN